MHWAVRLTVVLASGAAVFLAWRWTAPRTPTPAEYAAGAEDTAGDQSPSAADRRTSGDEPAARRPRVAQSSAVAPVCSVDYSAYPGAPSHDITGVISDRSGDPVAGAVITATPSELTFTGDGEDERLMLEWLTELHSLRATSDSQGRFRLTGTRALLRYDVRAAGWGHRLRVADGCDSYGVLPGGRIDFTPPALGQVRLDVRMPDGESARSAEVEVSTEGGDLPAVHRWSPASPLIRAEPGWATLDVRCGTFRGSAEGVVVAAGAESCVSVALLPHGSLRVRLTCPPELDPELVSVFALEGGESVDAGSRRQIGNFVDGAFEIPELAFGRWRVVADYPSGREAAREIVDLAAEISDVSMSLPPEDLRDFVIVRVLDSAGAPATDVELFGRWRSACTSRRHKGVSLGAGLFRLRHAAAINVRWGDEYSVAAYSQTLGARTVRYAGGVDEEIVIRFPPVASVTVRAQVADPEAVVRLEPEMPGDPWAGAEAPFVEGRAKFDRIPHGKWIVRSDALPGTAMRITVPCDGEVEYQGEPLVAWLVRRKEEYCPPAKLELHVGDLIIGIGDTEFRDVRHREELWAAAALDEHPVAIVLRAGERELIPLEPKEMSSKRASGATLEPALR